MRYPSLFCMFLTFWLVALPARAEFIISNAILEFTSESVTQQDIELISRSKDNDYIVAEVSRIDSPGSAQEQRVPLTDPADAGLLVTPDKSVLAAGSRKLLRFVLLAAPGEVERIYRVSLKPVIRGVANDNKVGLKVLVGYEVLVIVRPANIQPNAAIIRQGRKLLVTNRGNTNVILEQGKQCLAPGDCRDVPVKRVYAGQQSEIELPLDAAVTLSMWDGVESKEMHIN